MLLRYVYNTFVQRQHGEDRLKKVPEIPKQHTHQYTVHGGNRGKLTVTVPGRTSQEI